jgi:thiol-disulfide isomerase/thioredoxin
MYQKKEVINVKQENKKLNKRWILLLFVGIICIALGLVLSFKGFSVEPQTPNDTTAINYGYNRLDNSMYTSSGKPVVIFIGSDECTYCRAEKPLVLQVYQKYKDVIILDMLFDKFEPSLATQQCLDKSNFVGAVPYLNFGCQYERKGLAVEPDGTFNVEKEIQRLDYMFNSLIS